MRIVIVTTGGTIAEQQANQGRAHLTGRELLSDLNLPEVVDFEVVDLFDLPSTHLGFAEMLAVAQTVGQALAAGADGIVVTHGTDTLEETSYFVDLLVKPGAPIVFTAAMVPPGVAGTDGVVNLRNAIAIAATPQCRGLGVLVTMADEIHPARDVVKHHSMSIGAFKSPEFGPLGMVEEGRIYLARRLAFSETLPMPTREPAVEAIKCYAGMSDRLLRAVVDRDVEGLVVETLGSGQVPPSIMSALRSAVGAGISVVATARSPMGRLLATHYGMPTRVAGDERDLRDAGVIFSDLPGTKARVKLWLGLGGGLSADGLRRQFEHCAGYPAGPASAMHLPIATV